jgi:hypothetical protein
MEARIFDALKMGLDYRSASGLVGISEVTLRQWRLKDDDFATACEKAVAESKMFVSAQLMAKVRRGNMTAIIFWLKTRTTEFREKAPQEDGEDIEPQESFL